MKQLVTPLTAAVPYSVIAGFAAPVEATEFYATRLCGRLDKAHGKWWRGRQFRAQAHTHTHTRSC